MVVARSADGLGASEVAGLGLAAEADSAGTATHASAATAEIKASPLRRVWKTREKHDTIGYLRSLAGTITQRVRVGRYWPVALHCGQINANR
jgi:hypothetical protein